MGWGTLLPIYITVSSTNILLVELDLRGKSGMNSLNLLLWICAVILLQLLIYFGIGFWRHWINYRGISSVSGKFENDSRAVSIEFKPFRVDRKVIENASQTICSFYLVPEDGQPLPPYKPGQFLTFDLAVQGDSGETERIMRCYSLSDAPRTEHYRVSIKRITQTAKGDTHLGRSSNYFHDHITVGSLLQVRPPSGHFYLDQSDAPVVLIGGGIGITPLLSMLNWCLENQPEREVWLFFGVRNGHELIMKSQLDVLAQTHKNFHLLICASQPQPNESLGHDFQQQGRIDINFLRNTLPLKPFHFYICGASSMLESLVPALENWGVPEDHIHYEAFGPASIKRHNGQTVNASQKPRSDNNIVVSFSRSKKVISWQATAGNLLEFAEANGITVDSSCRAGACGMCQTKILSGEVSYAQPPDFDPAPGTCLLCSSIPKTNVTLEI
jgi:ferredoxin-NADP reductase